MEIPPDVPVIPSAEIVPVEGDEGLLGRGALGEVRRGRWVTAGGAETGVAIKRLEEAGVQVSAVKEFSDSVAQGRVVSMSPKAATVVDSGSTVEIVVSKGPPPVEVPDLIDMRQDNAVAELERLGLVAEIDDGAVTRLNRVFDQSPSPGEFVPRGTSVILRII